MTRKIGGTSDLCMYFGLKKKNDFFIFSNLFNFVLPMDQSTDLFSSAGSDVVCKVFLTSNYNIWTKNIYAILWSIIEMDHQLKHPSPGQPVADSEVYKEPM